jgi:hypothetical protein
MSKSIIWRTRFRRFLFYFSGSALAVASAVLIPAFGIWRELHSDQSIRYWLIGGLSLIFFICVRNYLEYGRLKYDPHWAMNFQDRFDNSAMTEARAKAATALLRNRTDLANIDNPALVEVDDVLDFLEDVGLYQRADNISPELAHHHFFHWTRGYWQAAKPYVMAWRVKEPARWKHVEELFDTSCDIELEEQAGTREQLRLSDSDLHDFLRQESELGKIDANRPWVVVRPYIHSPQFFPVWEKGDPIPQGDMGTWPIAHLFPSQILNVGKTPARIESYALDYVRTQIHPTEFPDEPAYHNVITQDILLVPNDEIAVTTALSPERGTLTKAQLSDIQKRREFLFAYGFVKYRHGDGSGPEYETRFGYIYEVPPTYAVMKEGKIEELSFQKATFNRGGKPAYNKAT